MPQVPLSWAAVTRLAGPLACASTLLLSLAAQAQEPIPASTIVQEQAHTIELEIGRDGATLQVTRSLFNPTLEYARVDLPLLLPCEAILDEVRIEERSPEGVARWRAAELLSPDEAGTRFDAYYLGSNDQVAGNSDTAVLVSRNDWRCDADLQLWPIPPVQQRTVAFRVFVPSVYEQGHYTIELPSFAGYGATPELELTGLPGDDLLASLGQTELSSTTILDGAQAHTIVLSPRDPGRGRVRAVDLDIDALVASTPAAAAKLAPDSGPLPRMLEAELAAPAELAKLPPVRRAVLLIDSSRSLSDYDREQLLVFGAAYFEALAAMDARVEVLLFDREVRHVYHDFVPAAWGAEDLVKLEFDARNGSEVGEAIGHARSLLAEPSEVDGADWIITLSDLYLRTDFDLGVQLEAAEAAATRMHVVRLVSDDRGLAPAAGDDPWTAIARAAGGMAWDADGDGSSFADELVSPKRIWNLGLELELADGSHRSDTLAPWFEAGGRWAWYDHQHTGAAMVRAAFVGEVWGQRRAWTASPDPIEGKRIAATYATNDATNQLSEAVRTALAFHAAVVSPFSSAWALAQFDGAAPAPMLGYGIGSCGGGSYGSSSRCGGVIGHRHPALSSPVGFDTLAQEALDRCKLSSDGRWSFETTDQEIVAVASSSRCVTAQTWATDIAPTESWGRKRVTVVYAGGQVTGVDVASL